MMPQIQEDLNVFVQAMKQYADTGKEVQMLHKFEELAMDLTARGAFGINERFVGKPDHPFIITSKAVARNIMKGPFHFIAQCTTRFGALMKPLFWLSLIIGDYSFDPLNAQTLEVIKLRKNNPSGELDYETVMKKLKYTGQVVDETMRLYPPGLSFVTRQAKEEYIYNGTRFKAGTCFMVPQYYVQRDPRYWPDPLEFKPERFSPDNEGTFKKTAYTAFGVGPRQCVGTRMSMLEMRCVAAKILQKYRLELGPSQKGTVVIGL
ncbi:hypothetical protein HPB52_003267 [Rhipicephalus sanguineus]|uniref:Cytochrome P450 n=1 Tax=Rhipicephalus sanguineus TaxID=34632 RepID=A0A9D4Q579_RHISA|nr:hypothetical protein HPB52_003267 [Rhipicephalus sanguineus]